MIRDLTRFMERFHRTPTTAALPPVEGTVLGYSGLGSPVVMPYPTTERGSHVLILGATGAGKTQLAAHALAEEHRALRRRGVENALIVVDPKGDLAAALVAELLVDETTTWDRVHVLDPFREAFPLNLNLLPRGATPIEVWSVQLAELMGIASTARGALQHLGVGSRQLDLAAHLVLAALTSQVDGASVLFALDALQFADGFARLRAVTSSSRARDFLESLRIGEELRASTSSRLRNAFAATESLERMIGARTAIDLPGLVGPGQITCLDLGSPPGGMASLQSFFSTLLVRLVLDHLMTRTSPWTGHAVRLVIDEAHLVVPVLGDVLERVLTTGRSRGVSLVILTQGLSPIHRDAPELLPVLATNVPLKLAGRMSALDAERFAREQAPEPGTEESIAEVRRRFLTQISGLPDRTFVALTPSGRVRFTATTVDVEQRARARDGSGDLLFRLRQRHALLDEGERVKLPATPPPRRPPRTRPPGGGSRFG